MAEGGNVDSNKPRTPPGRSSGASSVLPEYQWGSLKPVADLPDDSEDMSVAERFELLKAARHESTHLAQDLFSAFGCWSYCIAERILDEIFRTGCDGCEATQEVREVIIMLARLRRWHKMSVTAIEHDARRETSSIQKLDLLEILETDAMCSVYDSFYIGMISGLFHGDGTWLEAVRRELASAIYPRKYMHAWEWFLRVTGFDRADFILYRQDKESGRRKSPVYHTYRLFLDFALSTPFAVVGPREAEMNPAERFLRAVTGFMELPRESKRILESVNDDPHRVFCSLDRICGHSHDSWEETAAWISWLQRRYEATEDPIALARRDALKRKQDGYAKFLYRSPSIHADWVGVPSSFQDGQLWIGPTEWNMPFSLKRYTERLHANERYLVFLDLLAFAREITVTDNCCSVEVDPSYLAASERSEGKTVILELSLPLGRGVPPRRNGAIEDLVVLARDAH